MTEARLDPSAQGQPTGIRRRTLVGAAWAAPVVIAAVATPAASASGEPDFIILDSATPNPVVAGGQTVYSLQLVEQLGYDSTGTIAVNIKPPSFLTYTMSTEAGWTLDNQDDGLDFLYSPSIPANGSSSALLVTFTASSSAGGSSGNITSVIYAGTGGDSNAANNNSSESISVSFPD